MHAAQGVMQGGGHSPKAKEAHAAGQGGGAGRTRLDADEIRPAKSLPYADPIKRPLPSSPLSGHPRNACARGNASFSILSRSSKSRRDGQETLCKIQTTSIVAARRDLNHLLRKHASGGMSTGQTFKGLWQSIGLAAPPSQLTPRQETPVH